MDKNEPQIDPNDIDGLVKQIFALRPDAKERVTRELARKGPKRAKKK